MNLVLVYNVSGTGNMDVVLAYSIDVRIKEYNMKVLEDDNKLFPPYDASPVIRDDVLERYPKIEDITKHLENQISTEEMQQLNYKTDVENVSPRKVAEEFLEENNYFED